MVGEVLIDLFFGMFRLLFGGLELVNLPTQMISSLATIMAYGTWIVGADLLAIFVGSVVFWWGVHMSIGLSVWLWKLMPFV